MNRPRALFVVGLNFRTAPVALRERLAFRAADLPRVLPELLSRTGSAEAVVISTCNRVEVYAAGAPGDAQLPARLRAFLSGSRGVPEAEFAGALYELSDAAAAEHLFAVCASLDSQVLGETEVLGQAREAYRLAGEAGAAGPLCRALFERAFFLAKELRGAGGVGAGQASISSAAVQLAGQIFEDLRRHQVLVVGTGEMAAGIVKSLRAAGVADCVVAGRKKERTEQFAHRTGSRCGTLEDLTSLLGHADIVLVSTAAPHYVLTPQQIRAARPARHGRPLFVLDICVPRNVDPEVHRLPDTFLYNIDDLEEVARAGRALRERAAERWRPRLAEEARAVLNEWRDDEPDQVARRLLRQAAALRQAELEELQRSGRLDPDARGHVARALERFQARLLHGPLAALKGAARQGDGAVTAERVARLFRLDTAPPAPEEVGSAETSASSVEPPQLGSGGPADLGAGPPSPAAPEGTPKAPAGSGAPDAAPGATRPPPPP